MPTPDTIRTVPARRPATARFAVALLLAALAALAVRLPAADPATPAATPAADAAPPLWFADIQAPLPLPPATEALLAKGVFAELRRGKLGTNAFAELPYDATPRAVFVSASDGRTAARVSFGLGRGLQAAARAAVGASLAAGPPSHLRSVKVDVVQQALDVPAFYVREGQLPVPSLIGVAFFPEPRFAFPADQLSAGLWVSAQQQLRVHLVADYYVTLERREDLGHWNRLASYGGPQRVAFFETQGVFTDGQAVVPLFRGHRMRESLQATELLDMARRTGEFLARACTDKGAYAPADVPAWRADDESGRTLGREAEAALALLTLHELTRVAELRAAAGRSLAHVLATLKPDPYDRAAACVVEDIVVRLDTNAMVVLALLQAAAQGVPPANPDPLPKLGRYLLRQVQPDGDLVPERDAQSGNVTGTEAASTRAAALTACALAGLYEHSADRACLEAGRRVLGFVLRTQVEKRELDQLPVDEWLALALNALYTFDRDKAYLGHAERLALGILATGTAEPLFPDFVGSAGPDSPWVIPAARNVRALLALAELLRDSGRDEAVGQILAATHLGLLFMGHSFVDAPAAMHVAKPEACLGAFRDSCADYTFGLHTQGAALLALVDATRLARTRPNGLLPLDERTAARLQTALAATRRYPCVLPSRDRVGKIGSPAAGTAAPAAPRPGQPAVIPVPKTAPKR